MSVHKSGVQIETQRKQYVCNIFLITFYHILVFYTLYKLLNTVNQYTQKYSSSIYVKEIKKVEDSII